MSELTKHHSKVKKFIIIHDYETFGEKGDDGKSPGIKKAVDDFIQQRPEWVIAETHKKSNGLVVLSRNEENQKDNNINFSIDKLEALFVYRLFLPKEDEEKFVFLRSFQKRFEDFRKNVVSNSHVVVFIDNSPDHMIEKVKEEFGNIFEIIPVYSRSQKERLSSGNACSTQRYTLYISSMKVVESYLKSSPEAVIFFCEDDYLYRHDAFEKAYRFMKKHPNDFISLYDHPDRYRDSSRQNEPNLPRYNLELLWECNHHWRTSISTCHSFVATMKSLIQNDEFLLRASNELGDHDMWKQIWKNGKSKLYGAIPGLASHRRGPHLEDWDWNSCL
jgi:hypothetical protein